MPFVFDETDLDPRDGSVAGCKPERVRRTMKRGLAGAAVGKIEEKRMPEDFSGHRKRGAKHFKSPLLRQNRPVSIEACRFYFFTINSSLFTIILKVDFGK
ncbi:MAG: hypothetical protein IJC53_07070 [Clostridia bacterium]|nr:hypothetical protein [Clostridia bacterium]